MGIVKHPQSSQNSKFSMSLQKFKKEVRDDVDFLHADKHQHLLPADFNTSGNKVLYKVILSFLMGMIKHPDSAQSNKLVIAFSKSNISKKKVVIKLFNIN